MSRWPAPFRKGLLKDDWVIVRRHLAVGGTLRQACDRLRAFGVLITASNLDILLWRHLGASRDGR